MSVIPICYGSLDAIHLWSMRTFNSFCNKVSNGIYLIINHCLSTLSVCKISRRVDFLAIICWHSDWESKLIHDNCLWLMLAMIYLYRAIVISSWLAIEHGITFAWRMVSALLGLLHQLMTKCLLSICLYLLLLNFLISFELALFKSFRSSRMKRYLFYSDISLKSLSRP